MRELFTDDDGGISWTEDTVGPAGETPAELADDLRHMAAAYGAPILDLTLDPPRLVGP